MTHLLHHAPCDNILLESWQASLERFAAEPALLSPDGATLRSFEAVEQEARGLEKLLGGLAAGSVVAVRLGNSPQLPAVLIALFRAQLIPVLLGAQTRTASEPPVPEVCRASALIDENGRLHALDRPSPPRWHGPVPQFLKLTSGTTSAPRLVRFRASQLFADCVNICQTMAITRADRNFGVIPFSHSYGFSNLITPLLVFGIPLVVSADRMPRAILHDLARSGATVFPGMPVFFQKLAALNQVNALPRLRLCISAGAPLSAAVAQGFARKFSLKIHTFYGASECGGIGYDASPEAVHEDGFAGRALEGVDIEALGDGRIAVRSEAVGDGYYPADGEPALSAGRFVPGDLVRLSPAGMVITGRVSDLINIAGRKLNPLEIEECIMNCPGVSQAVVFGVPSALRGEEPVVCVAGGDRAAILRYCQSQLSSWLRPKDVWLVDEIPTNERGKISRQALAERYLARV